MRVGFDLGSLYIKAVIFDRNNNILQGWFIEHKGRVRESLESILKEGEKYLEKADFLGVTGSFAKTIFPKKIPIDGINALITGTLRYIPDAKNIINIGGGSLSLIELNGNGEFINLTSNSLCAAGTGSFLDQQAFRMGMAQQQEDADTVVKKPPEIATRCAVFAKTDIIHRQQEGFTKPEIWCGLCKGLSSTILSTLLKGRLLDGTVVLTGGVALNPQIQNWLKKEFSDGFKIPQNPQFIQAVGAAILGEHKIEDLLGVIRSEQVQKTAVRSSGLRKPLDLRISKVPSFDVQAVWVDDNNTECRLKEWDFSGNVKAFLGIDIGSTSTKAVIIDNNADILADFYRKTEGDPIGATKKIFSAITYLCEKNETVLEIIGSATTGSGRKMIGTITGADTIVNEITAHAHGALHFNKDIETIFEIGGQDSKYIYLKNGRVHLVNMNYVCAAGTGSFVEEQANRLGFKVQDIGRVVMGITPPVTSDRCTVFMEQDIDRLLRDGYSREEVMAAVMYSVVQNYLIKVVGNRPVSNGKIFFQGATARNAGLVAAFEQYLGKEIIVHPSCHVMGALGAAIIARKKIQSGVKTSFRGFDIFKRDVSLSAENCNLCSNVCRISFADIDGLDKKPSWGYMCGREPDEQKAKYKEYNDLFEFRERLLLTVGSGGRKKQNGYTIGLPWALSTYTYMPLWRVFLRELGFNVRISPRTNDILLKKSIESVQADFCLPAKLINGHMQYFYDNKNVDFIFLPSMIASEKRHSTTNTCFCPYLQAAPAISNHINNGRDSKHIGILSPVIDFRKKEWEIIDELKSVLGRFDISVAEIKKAYRRGMESQREFARICMAKGKDVLRELKEKGEQGMVIIGRPYNVCDPRVNLNIPKKIAGLGYRVIPLDMIPFDISNLGKEFNNMFWSYGQVIVNAMKVVKDYDNLFPVYLTSFSCGPDSFILTYAEEIAGDKPILILELDEHGADAGYTTRIEAFRDAIKSGSSSKSKFSIYIPDVKKSELKKRKILIPPMHSVGAKLLAAAMRGYGYNAVSLPDDNLESYTVGKSLTRGGECMPAAVTIGNIVKTIQESERNGGYAIFMPTSSGPCRFGQYVTLHRLILNRLGYTDVPIISPSADNAYYGFDMDTRREMWKAILAGDILLKMLCKTKPYELRDGDSDRVMQRSIELIEKGFENRKDYRSVLESVTRDFMQIERSEVNKPIAGIVGEIFVRCNSFSNGSIIDVIEECGGEAWLAPVSEWILYTSYLHNDQAIKTKNLNEIFTAFFKNRFIMKEEHKAYEVVKPMLYNRVEPSIKEVVEEGAKYLSQDFTAEAILSVGRAVIFARQGASIIANVSPFTCMPGTISAAIFQNIQKEYGIPIVNLFYDGEHGENERLRTFMSNLKNKSSFQINSVAG